MEPDRRDEMLLRMYGQMFDDIKTQTQVVWQSVTVLAGAFALLSLVEKNIMPLDIAVSLIMVLCGWFAAHTINAGYWYNRNLVIIANIERQFLEKTDLNEIHYYFGKHRESGKLETHLRIQLRFAVLIAAVLVLYHGLERAYPELSQWLEARKAASVLIVGPPAPPPPFPLTAVLPYAVLVGVIWWCVSVWRHRRQSYEEFLKNSPGKSIATDGIDYGVGHPAASPPVPAPAPPARPAAS